MCGADACRARETGRGHIDRFRKPYTTLLVGVHVCETPRGLHQILRPPRLGRSLSTVNIVPLPLFLVKRGREDARATVGADKKGHSLQGVPRKCILLDSLATAFLRLGSTDVSLTSDSSSCPGWEGRSSKPSTSRSPSRPTGLEAGMLLPLSDHQVCSETLRHALISIMTAWIRSLSSRVLDASQPRCRSCKQTHPPQPF